MSNYNNAYTEVYTILNCLDEEELSKIPEETLAAIEENIIMNQMKNQNYENNQCYQKQKLYYLICFEIIFQHQNKKKK